MLDDRAVATAARARLREREEAVRVRSHAAPAALRTDGRRRAGLGARARARVAGGLELDRHAHLRPCERVLERERHLRLDVCAALRLPGRLRPAPSAAAEEAAEQVAEVAELEVLELRPGGATPAVRGAPRVVRLALLRVGEHVIRALDLLEARLVTALVGMVLPRELAVGLLDLVGRGALRDAERVVQSRRHLRRHDHSATMTRAGRSTRSPSV